MPEFIRTFVAVKVEYSDKISGLLDVFKKSLKNEPIKWVEENNLHLTLRFMGDTTEQQLDEIEKGLKGEIKKISPFEFHLKGTGFFKSNGQPRVLFIKLEEFEKLGEIAQIAEKIAVEAGLDAVNREFNPHLTLGRIKYLKNKRDFYTLVEKYADTYIQKINVTRVIFYQSRLLPAGPVYNPLEIYNLK